MSILRRSLALLALTAVASPAFALPVFFNTTTANESWANWQVATNLPGNDADGTNVDGQYASFPVNGPFAKAAACTNVPLIWGATQPLRANWIANIPSCSNSTDGSSIGNGQWTFFLFRQQFQVTAADLPGLTLSFRWAADDSGEVKLVRGSWKPGWSLNSTAQADIVQVNYWPDPLASSYDLGSTVSVTGFKEGLNTMYFWVQGNGVTDGMMLMDARFTNQAVPEPSSLALMGLALLGVGAARRRRIGR